MLKLVHNLYINTIISHLDRITFNHNIKTHISIPKQKALSKCAFKYKPVNDIPTGHTTHDQ